MGKNFKNPWAKGGENFPDWKENFKANMSNNSNTRPDWGCSSGIIELKGFTANELELIRIISEEGDPYKPSKNGTYSGDGFYYKYYTDAKYWYKVSGGSSVLVQNTNRFIITTPNVSSFCKALAEAAGKYYKVGWEPKSKNHWTVNPFDK